MRKLILLLILVVNQVLFGAEYIKDEDHADEVILKNDGIKKSLVTQQKYLDEYVSKGEASKSFIRCLEKDNEGRLQFAFPQELWAKIVQFARIPRPFVMYKKSFYESKLYKKFVGLTIREHINKHCLPDVKKSSIICRESYAIEKDRFFLLPDSFSLPDVKIVVFYPEYKENGNLSIYYYYFISGSNSSGYCVGSIDDINNPTDLALGVNHRFLVYLYRHYKKNIFLRKNL